MPITELRTPRGYCTPQDVENYLLTDINDSFSDQVNNWISTAEDAVDNYLGYTTSSGILNELIIEEVSETAKVDSNLNLVVYPRKSPINSVEKIELIKGTSSMSLTLSGGTRVDYNGDTVTQYKYQIPEPRHKIVFPSSELSSDGGSFLIGSFSQLRGSQFLTRMTYRAGYTQIPAEINLATTMLVSEITLRHQNKEGLQSLQQGRITKEWFNRKGGESDLVIDAFNTLSTLRRASSWLIR